MTQKIMISNIALVQSAQFPANAVFGQTAESDCLSVRYFGTIVTNYRTWRAQKYHRMEDAMPGVKRERDDSVGT